MVPHLNWNGVYVSVDMQTNLIFVQKTHKLGSKFSLTMQPLFNYI